jgi:AMP-binding enzyme
MLEAWQQRWYESVERHHDLVALVSPEGTCRFGELGSWAQHWRRHYETSAGWCVGRCVDDPWRHPRFDLPRLIGLWLAGGVWIARSPEAVGRPLPSSLAGPRHGAGCWQSILFSSGSTGPAKMLVRGWRQVLGEADAYARLLDLSAGSHSVMLIHPWFGASTKQLFAALLHGWSQSFGLSGLTQSRDRSDLLYATPSQLQGLEEEDLSPGGFHWISLTGESCPESLWPRLQSLSAPGGRCLNALGATETGVVANQILALDSPWRPLEGVPAVGKQVDLVDDQGNHLTTRQSIGRLRIRSAALLEGRLLIDAAGQWALAPLPMDQGLMVHLSQDLARWSAAGALELLGRSDALLKRHGQWIDATPLQRLLEQQPGVRRCQILAEAEGNAAWLEVDSPGVAWLQTVAEAVDSAIREQLLDASLRPTRLHALERLPLNANGKLDLAVLRCGDTGNAISVALSPPLPLWLPTLDSLDQAQLVAQLQAINLLWCGGGLQALAEHRPPSLGLLGLGFPDAPPDWHPSCTTGLSPIMRGELDQLLMSCSGDLGEQIWIGGYSLPAWFAYAMAVDLVERGYPVAGVVLLDPPNPFGGTYRWRWRRLLSHRWRLGAGAWFYRRIPMQRLRRKSWRQALVGNWTPQPLPEAVSLVVIRSSWRAGLSWARAKTLQSNVQLDQLSARDHESVMTDDTQIQQWLPLVLERLRNPLEACQPSGVKSDSDLC